MNSTYGPVWGSVWSFPGWRDPATTQAIIEQFEVGPQNETYARYKVDSNGSKCNIYAGDVLRNMLVSLPTKDDLGGINGGGNITAGCAVLSQWFNGNKFWSTAYPTGPEAGWIKINTSSQSDLNWLLAHVKAGKPAVAISGSPNHIVVLRPDQDVTQLNQWNLGQLVTAQAGAQNFVRGTLAQSWGSYGLSSVQFFIHE
jgi:hypothetical protein